MQYGITEDEWLLVSLKENEARDLLEIVEARHQKSVPYSAHSLLLPVGKEKSVKTTLAYAILDRIVHSPYTITIEDMDLIRIRKGPFK